MNLFKYMKLKLRKIVLASLMLISCLAYGQTQGDRDWASWNTIGIDYKANDKWSFSLEEQLRLKENISAIDNYFTQLSANYELFNDFEIGVGIRYIRENDNQGAVQGYENFFRFQVELNYKHKFNNFKIGYRLRYQNKNELGVSYDEGDFPNQNIRFKTSIGYNIKNWSLDPKLSAEIFNRFQEGKENGFNKYRLTVGTDYKIKNFGKIGAFYRYEKDLNVDLPDVTNIIGLKYTYSIKRSKK